MLSASDANVCWSRVTDAVIKFSCNYLKYSNNTRSQFVSRSNNKIVIRKLYFIFHVHDNCRLLVSRRQTKWDLGFVVLTQTSYIMGSKYASELYQILVSCPSKFGVSMVMVLGILSSLQLYINSCDMPLPLMC